MHSVVLGTAGHIDHGKTALVLALTGTDTDRLPEEKARGITIDLGFAAMELKGPGGQVFDVSVIDVPGHHAFVRNMLAGAGGIDAVMLVIAADEGVKAQTLEHLQICRLLGIQRGLVVLTKRDAVSAERLEAAREDVARLVEGSFLQGAPVMSVSALKREGIAELKLTLAALVASIPRRSQDRVARLPVDRVFSVKGFGTVVTGTLQAGSVRAGQSLLLEPERRSVRVRGVQVHGKARAEATAPNRVALNLAGVEVSDVHRGDTVIPEGTLAAVSVLDVELEILAGAPALRHRQRVRVHAFASESLATVLRFREADGIGPDADRSPLVRLRLAKPLLVVPGDRLVLRLPSPAITVGGGRVLDAAPLSRLRKPATAAWLRQLRGATPAEALHLRITRRGDRGVSSAQLVAETGWQREAVQLLLAPLLADKTLLWAPGNDALIARIAMEQVQERVHGEVARAKGGASTRAELQSRTRLPEWVFGMALARLQAAHRIVIQGDLLTLPGARERTGQDTAGDGSMAKLEGLYRAAGLASPIVSEVAERTGMSATELRQGLTALLRAGKLIRLGSDALLVHAEAVATLVTQLREQRGQTLDVGRFKTLTGLSRKHAIPMLEYLDGARVTRNAGGVRTVV